VTIAAPVLALGGFVLLEWGAEPVTKTPELEVWKLLIAVQVAAWAIFFGIGIKGLGDLVALQTKWLPERSIPASRKRRRETVRFVALVYGSLFLLSVLGAVAGLRYPSIFAGQGWKLPLVSVVAGGPHRPSSWA
jgi:hypothetical protein